MKEKQAIGIPGVIALMAQLALLAYIVYSGFRMGDIWALITWVDFILPVLALVGIIIVWAGYVTVNINEAVILQFLGHYKGTLINVGWQWVNPFWGKVNNPSTQMQNYETKVIKVNESGGTPIEIAAVMSYKLVDTYKFQYDVEHPIDYLKNQAEVALRDYAKQHTYKVISEDSPEFIKDLQTHVDITGIQILDVRISHLNYAEEIAAAMLQRQQAQAMSEAKQTIVENATNIAKAAAEHMNGDMTATDKSKFIANLIIVLCSDRGVSPIVSVE